MRPNRRQFLGAAAATAAAGSFSRAQAQDTGTMTFALAARSPNSLEPAFVVQGADNWVNMQIFDTLVRPEDGTFAVTPGEFKPSLAESWTTSADGRTWTFQLRKGVKFHGGYGEVTADDIVFTFERLLDPKKPVDRQPLYAGTMESIKAEGPGTVTFKLKRPDPLFCGSMLAPVVSSTASAGLRLGSAARAAATVAKGGGRVSLPCCGTPVRSGGGSVWYAPLALSGAPMKYLACGSTLNCAARANFCPGLPFSSTMPRESRLSMRWPWRGL